MPASDSSKTLKASRKPFYIVSFSGNNVDENLGKYLRQAQGLRQIGGCEEHYIELCLMVIQSLEVRTFSHGL